MFTENKPTEPICFIFFKKICSLSLIMILIWFTINEFGKYSDSVFKPNLSYSNQHLLDLNLPDYLGQNKEFKLTNNVTIEFCHLNPIKINSCAKYTYDYNSFYNFNNFAANNNSECKFQQNNTFSAYSKVNDANCVV